VRRHTGPSPAARRWANSSAASFFQSVSKIAWRRAATDDIRIWSSTYLHIRALRSIAEIHKFTDAYLSIGCDKALLMAATKPSRSSWNMLYTNGGSRNCNVPCCVHHLVLSLGSSRFHCRRTHDLWRFSTC
jgi:hypothetical protein